MRRKNKRAVLLASVVVFAVGFILLLLLSPRTPLPQSASLDPAAVREIDRVVRNSRWKQLANTILAGDLAQTQLKFREIVTGKLPSVTSTAPDRAIYSFKEETPQGFVWFYNLNHSSNGWRITGRGYRKPTVTALP